MAAKIVAALLAASRLSRLMAKMIKKLKVQVVTPTGQAAMSERITEAGLKKRIKILTKR